MNEETLLTYGQIFKYEFNKANGSSVNQDYEIAAKAIIAEYERRTNSIKEKVVFQCTLPNPEAIASIMCDYLPGTKFRYLNNELRKQWVDSALMLVQFIRDYQCPQKF